MKICPICQRCYEDAASTCPEDHAALATERAGTRLLVGKYRLDRLLGRGDKGVAYEAIDTELDSPVVTVELYGTKVIDDPEEMRRFHRESRAAARTNNQDVGDIYDYGALPEGRAYVVMDLVEGELRREDVGAETILAAPPIAPTSPASPESARDTSSETVTVETEAAVAADAEEETRTSLPPVNAAEILHHIIGDETITPEKREWQHGTFLPPNAVPPPVVNVDMNVRPPAPVVVKVPGNNYRHRDRRPLIYATLAASVLVIALAWFAFNRERSDSANSADTSVATPMAETSPTNSPLTESPATRTVPLTGTDSSPASGITNNPPPVMTTSGRSTQSNAPRAVIRRAFDEWVGATVARDVDWKSSFYMPVVSTFYSKKNVSRDSLGEERTLLFPEAGIIDMRVIGEPRITFSEGRSVATMRIRLGYLTEGGGQNTRREVTREIRWRKTDEGWKIFSERDL